MLPCHLLHAVDVCLTLVTPLNPHFAHVDKSTQIQTSVLARLLFVQEIVVQLLSFASVLHCAASTAFI